MRQNPPSSIEILYSNAGILSKPNVSFFYSSAENDLSISIIFWLISNLSPFIPRFLNSGMLPQLHFPLVFTDFADDEM
jgi:hypothetical protein